MNHSEVNRDCLTGADSLHDLPPYQNFNRIVGYSEVNHPDVLGTNRLSEMYPCQNFNQIVGNSDVNRNDLMVEPLKQKVWDGQFPEQLRL